MENHPNVGQSNLTFTFKLSPITLELHLNFCAFHLNFHSSPLHLVLQLQARNRRNGPGVPGGGLEEPLLRGGLGNWQVGL